MAGPTQALCVMLEQLADNSDPKVDDVSDFYSAVFEFGHLNESEVLEFNDAERIAIIKSFPAAIQKAAKFTPELIQSKSSSKQEIDQMLAKIKVVTDDLYEIYKQAVEGEVPADVEKDIQSIKAEEKQGHEKMGN